MLCQNRPDGGLGPYTALPGVHVLTSCFDDTILVPLGCWLFILGTAVLSVVFLGRRDRDTSYLEREQAIPLEQSNKDRTPIQKVMLLNGGKWPKTRRFLLVMTAFLLIANFAMHVLEIARLAANDDGIGLLPFCLVPIVIVLISLWVPSPAWSKGGWSKPARPHGVAWVALVNFWMLWMAITSGVKLWSLSRVETAIGQEAFDGKDSKYPYSDRIVRLSHGKLTKIDTIVILCVYYAAWLFYLHQIYLEYVRYNWRWFW